MTTFTVAAPTPIASSVRPFTPQTQRTTTPSRGVSPTTVGNSNGAMQGAQPSTDTARTETSHEPNAFLTRMDELAQVILDGPQVTWAIEQGMSAAEIAGKYGIRQGGDAFTALKSRVEARRLGAAGDGLGA